MKYKLMIDEKLHGTKYFLAYYKRDYSLNVDLALTGTYFNDVKDPVDHLR